MPIAPFPRGTGVSDMALSQLKHYLYKVNAGNQDWLSFHTYKKSLSLAVLTLRSAL